MRSSCSASIHHHVYHVTLRVDHLCVLVVTAQRGWRAMLLTRYLSHFMGFDSLMLQLLTLETKALGERSVDLCKKRKSSLNPHTS